MLQVIEDKGFGSGGFNFDAKLRRQSVDPADLYLAHIGGVDTLARALLAAADVVTERKLAQLKQERYQRWDGDLGARIENGAIDLATLADLAVAKNFDPTPKSGRQELAESIIARHCRH